MPELRKNFTENINQKKLKELKDYVLDFKGVKDKFYDPKVHINWEETFISISEDKPLKWSVFRIYIKKEDYSIYTFSDENGRVSLPNDEAEEYDIDIIHTNDESTFNNLFEESNQQQQQQPKKTEWKYEIAGLILALIIGYVSFILPGQIRNYKLQKDRNLINEMVSKPYADFENYRRQIINKVQLLEQENPFIYVYTNDTEPLDFRILPNVKIYQNNNNYSLHFNTKRIQADDLKYFLDNEDDKGYNIWLNTAKTQIAIGNYNKNTATEFNVSMSYFYTEKTKEHLKKQATKRKRQRLTNLDSIQTARVTISENFEVKPRNKLVGLLMRFDEKIIQSAIKKKSPTHKVYFSFYSKNGSKEDLESKIKNFEKLFFNGKKSKDYKIRKVYLKK